MYAYIQDGNQGGTASSHGRYSPPQLHGFDECFSTESKVPTWHDRKAVVTTRYWNEKGEYMKEPMDGDDSQLIMNRTEPFIRTAVGANKPFFAVVWFHTPHLPVVAGPKYLKMYKHMPEAHRHYFGSITAMDEQIGRLRALVRELGMCIYMLRHLFMYWCVCVNISEKNKYLTCKNV
jgi:arylsulfatase A-like enzyme